MTQALYAHTNNKTIKKKILSEKKKVHLVEERIVVTRGFRRVWEGEVGGLGNRHQNRQEELVIVSYNTVG
jgi:hypothetical protein